MEYRPRDMVGGTQFLNLGSVAAQQYSVGNSNATCVSLNRLEPVNWVGHDVYASAEG